MFFTFNAYLLRSESRSLYHTTSEMKVSKSVNVATLTDFGVKIISYYDI